MIEKFSEVEFPRKTGLISALISFIIFFTSNSVLPLVLIPLISFVLGYALGKTFLSIENRVLRIISIFVIAMLLIVINLGVVVFLSQGCLSGFQYTAQHIVTGTEKTFTGCGSAHPWYYITN